MSTINLTDATFDETMNKQGVVLIDWWASWCGPCRAFAPVFEGASRAHPDVTFAKVDTEAEPGLAGAFQVRAIPTLSILRDGVLVFHRAGMVSRAALDDLISQAQNLDIEAVKKEMAEKQVAGAA